MVEHATLFKPEMVRAVLRDVAPKTQTRRLITARNSLVDGVGMSQKRWDAMGFDFSRAWVDHGPSPAGNPGPYLKVPAVRDGDEFVHRIYPRVQPGDRLWGREAWAADPPIDDTWASTEWAGCGRVISEIPDRFRHPRFCLYAADWLHGDIVWTPSIHMPRWACRMVLPVDRVRVQILQNISAEDCIAEGIVSTLRGHDAVCDLRDQYRALWEHINGPGSWALNPMVWVTEFRRLT